MEDKTLVYFGPSGIGDWCFILPTLNRLLSHLECTRVCAVLPRSNVANELLLLHPAIDQAIYLSRPDSVEGLFQYGLRSVESLRAIRALRAKAVVVSYLSNQPDVLALALLSGARTRVGWRHHGTLLERLALNRPITKGDSAGKRNIHSMFAGLKVDSSPPFDILGVLDSHEVSMPLPDHYVVLAVGGGRRSEWRFWPASHFLELAKMLPNQDFVLMGGGKSDLKAARAIMQGAPPNCIDLVDNIPFEHALEILRNSQAVVGNDSGLANLSSAHGIPTLTLYGPTNPLLTGPALLGSEVESIEVPCGPCFGESQDPSTALACSHKECLVQLQPEAVAERLKLILNTTRSSLH